MSGLIETETSICTNNPDTLAKFAEHLMIRSNFESATENMMAAYEDEEDD